MLAERNSTNISTTGITNGRKEKNNKEKTN